VSTPFANFLLGAPVVFFQAGGELPRGLRNHDLSFYAQDEYKFSPRVTLNLGLRYQVNTPFTEIQDRLAGFRPGQESQVQPEAPVGLIYPGDTGVPKGLIPTYKKGLSPRVGIAWDPSGTGEMSIRAFYGVYFESLVNGQGGILQTPISAPPYLQARQVQGLFLSAFGIPGPSFADPFSGISNPFPAGNFPLPLTHLTVENNLLPPYIQNWNLSLQREFAQKYLVEIRYVGTKGTRLPRFIEGNPAVYIPGQSTPDNIDQRRVYAGCKGDSGPCDFASVGLISGSANSTYHALQSTVSRKFSKGLFFSSSYTLSKSLDYVSSLNESGSAPRNVAGENDLPQNPFDWNAEHGPSLFDARHRFVTSASWEIPILNNSSGLTKFLFGNWQINGIANLSSGTPFTVYDSRDVAQQGSAPEITGFSANRPNLIGDPNQGPRTVERWFNIDAFQRLDPIINAGQFGDAGRNVVRGPGFHVLDLSVFKTFKFRETKQIQFRVECFNLANHPNFFLPENDIGSANFGRVLQAGPPRLLQFALKLIY
jgi:TonB dependent receptor